jgi:regulatory protein
MTATASDPDREIGALVPDPRVPGRVRIMVRGRVVLTIPHQVADAERLTPGMRLSEPLYARLCRAADEEAAFRTALLKLKSRPFAEHDLKRRLVLKGHPPGAAAAAVERARAAGLVDDAQFARHFIETRSARGRGPLRLRRELAAMGVDRFLVDRTLAAVSGEGEGEPAQIERLLQRRLPQLRGLSRPVTRRRLLSFLARRGFSGLAAREAVERATGRESA